MKKRTDRELVEMLPQRIQYKSSYGQGLLYTVFYTETGWYVHLKCHKKRTFYGPFSKDEATDFARKKALD